LPVLEFVAQARCSLLAGGAMNALVCHLAQPSRHLDVGRHDVELLAALRNWLDKGT
jgi:hypothetical protein